FCYFFFQAEDGIRDFHVTGVQTCALPIYPGSWKCLRLRNIDARSQWGAKTRHGRRMDCQRVRILRAERGPCTATAWFLQTAALRSEERRVGKECRSVGGGDDTKDKERTRV